ncbi:MAG: hypothetical protein QM775_08780 [Pirellulales bacterium]
MRVTRTTSNTPTACARGYVVVHLDWAEQPQATPPVAENDVYTVYAPYDSGGMQIYWPDYQPDTSNDYDPENDGFEIGDNNNPGGYEWIAAGGSASYSYTIVDNSGGETTAYVIVQVEEEEAPTNTRSDAGA